MTTLELISYIKKQIKNNISKDIILSKLLSVGWKIEDIEEGFSVAEKEINNFQINTTIQIEKRPLNIDSIKKEEPKIEDTIINQNNKVWVPMSVPVKEKNIKNEITDIVIKNTELEASPKDMITAEKKEEDSFGKKNIIINPKYFNKAEDIVLNIPPKKTFNFLGSFNKDVKEIKTDKEPDIKKEEVGNNTPLANVDLPKIAMLSSYQSDISLINKQNEEEKGKDNKKMIFKWGILIIIILAISFLVWGISSGFVSLNNLNFFSIKKDPRSLILTNSEVLSSLKSYKTETNVEISSPSFNSISSGLITGEVVPSLDKDFISLNTLGIINRNNNQLTYDNFITIKSSLLQDYVTTDIKSNGSDLFIDIPDLRKIISENAPESSIVKMSENDFNLIPALFPENIKVILEKVNIYKVLSSGMPSYVNDETLGAYNDLINKVEIIEKGLENIKGIDTYHYSISTDRQMSKDILTKISDNFSSNISEEDKTNLNEILGSITITSFDVWVGKGDNNIYQYNFVIDIPLSKILGFEDKSIGNSKITVNWKTTYYDFNVPNNIFISEKSISVNEFINNFKKEQLKNEVSSFKQIATNLFNVEKSIVMKSNLTGSCMNPTYGSLFSPLGHSKKATSEISAMSVLLNKILGYTNSVGSCYSNSKDWSFTIPISVNYDTDYINTNGYESFFCIDSTGVKKDLTSFPSGVNCSVKEEVVNTEKQ